ncbi:hypothetical protein HNR71_001525 [Kribbella sandramycini]|uniref:Uncharacterized protein n=1 Tax=Kribbella sandramycini TaxID=60450 RepID=A0A841S141_9ACTN|nr:hypothetical protein [Kribbella sandramycini]
MDVLGLTLFLRTSERAGGRRGSEQLRSSHQAKMADRRRAWGEPGELRSGA